MNSLLILILVCVVILLWRMRSKPNASNHNSSDESSQYIRINLEDALKAFDEEPSLNSIQATVNDRPTFYYATTHKHDLPMMLKCVQAEMNASEKTDWDQAPAPYDFERIAILARKQKDYNLEVKTCEQLISAMEKWKNNIESKGLIPGQNIANHAASPRAASVKARLPKAKVLLAKHTK